MLSVGEELGRYELIAHLSDGGMASLYLGRRIDPPDNRIFAIKAVHPHFLDDEQLVEMFRDEAGLSVRIRHPNVVRVEEVGEDRDLHFLAMEYIHGCSLAQLLQALVRRRRRMSPELATYLAMAVADGLHAAHETRGPAGEPLNVVHRDVSPQNILVSHTGEIKLIDFGIAKSRMQVHQSLSGAAVKGKLRYMAPEHAGRDAVDKRTDIYALGIILWELLTMRPLFWSDNDFELVKLVRDPQIEPPVQHAPHIPQALSDVVMQALARDKADRPASALAFRQALGSAMPLADALEEEQISELLHVVLGDEFNRKRNQLPNLVAVELSEVPPKELSPDVLDTLTSPAFDAELLERSLAEEGGAAAAPPPTAGTDNSDDDDVEVSVTHTDEAVPEEDMPTMVSQALPELLAMAEAAKGEGAPKPTPPATAAAATGGASTQDGREATAKSSWVPEEVLDEAERASGMPAPNEHLPVLVAIGVGGLIVVGIGLAMMLWT